MRLFPLRSHLMAEADRLLQAVCFFGDDCDRLAKITDMCYNIIRSQSGRVLFPRRRQGKDMGRSIILLFTAFLVGVLKG